MNDGAPSLEVGLEITTAGAFSALTQLAALMDTTEFKAVNSFKEIERAIGGSVNLAAATTSITTFGNAATRVEQDVRREKAATEAAIDRMVKKLDQQTAAVGRTREEQQSARIEELALAADRQKNSDAADRLLVSVRALGAAQAALAEDQDQAARKAVAAAEAQAQAIRSAAFAHDQFEAAARRGMAAYREQQAAEAAANSETERHAAAAERLRASLDPAYAAQQRFDQEMGQARTLIGAGAISLDEYCAKLRAEQGALEQANNTHHEATEKSGALRYAFQDLGYQIQDVGASLSTVSGPAGLFRIFAQQGGQVFDALNRISMAGGETSKEVKATGGAAGEAGTDIAGLGDQMTGVAEKVEHTGSKFSAVAGFMAGPWGAAILVGITVLGPLVGKLFETNDALDEVVKKLKEDAKATEANDQAKKAFQHSVEGVTAAIKEQAAAYDQLAHGERSAAERQNILARDTYTAAAAIRDKTRADLEAQRVQAQADYNAARVRAAAPGQRGENAALALGTADATLAARLQSINDAMKAVDGAALQAFKNYQASRIGVAKETAKALATVEGQINAKYDEQAKRVTIAAYVKAKAGGIVDAALTRELEGIERNRKAALKAEEDRQSEAKKTANQIGRNITLAEARSIAEGIGGRVTSDHRSYAEQAKLYAKYQAYKAGTGPWAALAAKPGTSNHELDQALDVAKSGGMTLKKLVNAYQSAGVKLVEALDEGDHYHVAWKKVGAAAKQQSAEVTAAARDALQAAAGQAQITNLYDLAKAYKATGGEALIAEARLKAESEAIKRHGDDEAAVSQQIQIAIAKRIADGAQMTATLNDQAVVQERVNAQVAAGIVPASQAAQVLQQQVALQPLLAAQEAARLSRDKVGYDAATAGLAALTAAQERDIKAKRNAQYLSSLGNGDDDLARLKLEGQLIGANVDQRAHELAVLKAIQDEQKQGFTVIPELDSAVQQAGKLADQAQINLHNNDAYNASLTETADHWDIIANKVQSAGQGMADAFGSAGKAIGDVASIYSSYMANQARLQEERNRAVAAAGNSEKLIAIANQRYAAQTSGLQVAAFQEAAGAAKGLFAEHSAGYEAMAATEKALAAWRAIQAVRDVAAGAAKMFASLGPLGFAAVAAMVGVMAGFGISSGGGSSVKPPSADDIQKATGTGTVLGSPNGKSASIAHSLDLVAKNTADDLGIGNAMLVSLKAINTSIVAMAATVGKQISVNGSLGDTSKLNLGSSGSAGFVGLFASSTTRSLYDAGITLAATTVGNIVASGISGQTYQIVEQVKKSSGFLGIGGGTKTTYQTSTGALPSDISASIQSVIGALENGIVAAASAMGNNGAKAMLDSFTVDIGKLSFNGLDAQGIQDQLNAVFSSVGDKMVTAIMPGIAKFQQAGEGLFETLERVASTVVAVDAEMAKLGVSATGLGVDIDMGIASKFDSVSDFTSAADSYFKSYYSAAEQTAAKTSQMAKAFDGLGLTMPATLAGFRQLAEAQDLTTAAGQSTYATLLQLAPAFADLNTTMDGAKSAADIASERADLQKQLWQALGDSASIRAAELAEIDPSNRALKQRLYDLADEAAAMEAANRVAQERTGLQSALNQLLGDTAAMRVEELAALDPANRALKLQIFALQDQQAAAAAAAQAEQEAAQAAAAAAQERKGIEQQLLQLQGKTAELRQRELALLDPTSRALQQQVYDLTDLQAAQAAAAAVAQERAGLESQLLQLQNDTVALRARELAELDPTNRALREQIFALTDLQAAQVAATQAAQEAAQERAGIEQQLLQLQGRTAELRERELAGLDASNRALMGQVYALQDQQAATAAATQAAQEAAQAEQAIAQERAGLMQQLWQLTGDTASIRAAALAALDPSNRALQEQIYAISDAQDAAKAAQALADAWKTVGDSIMDEITRIRGLGTTGGASFASLQGQFNAAVTAARGGDQDAAKGLPELSKSLLDAAALAATSRQELARVEAQTAGALQSVYDMIGSAVGASGAATSAVLGTAVSNDNASASGAQWWTTFANTASAASAGGGNDDLVSEIRELRAEVAGMRAENNKGHANTATAAEKGSNALDRASRLGGGSALATVKAA